MKERHEKGGKEVAEVKCEDFVSATVEFFPKSMQHIIGFTKCSWYGRLHVEREVEVTSRVSHCVKSWNVEVESV